MSHQYATLEDTIYLWFGANDTAGSGADGSTPVFDVREGGAAAGAAPVLSGAATLLSHASYPDGCHEVAVAATAANGFAANKTYGVFCTLLVDSQNPTGFVGSFRLAPVPAALADVAQGGTSLVLTLGQLVINSSAATGALDIDNSVGPCVRMDQGSGASLACVYIVAGNDNSGVVIRGSNLGSGLVVQAGATNIDGALYVAGGSTSGPGIVVTTTDGHAVEFNAAGASKVSLNCPDGITANITGNLSGSIGAVGLDGITADAIAASAINEIQSGLATAASLSVVAGYVDTEVQSLLTSTGVILTRIGVPTGVSLAADIAAIESQTDDIGVAGAGLTAVPWNPAWDAEVQSEVVDALTAEGYTSARAVNLDELGAANIPADVDSIKAKTVNLPANPAAVGSPMTLDMTQAIGSAPADGTVGAAMLGLEAQAVGKWTIVGTTLTLYRRDGTTVVRTFTLDSSSNPTSRA